MNHLFILIFTLGFVAFASAQQSSKGNVLGQTALNNPNGDKAKPAVGQAAKDSGQPKTTSKNPMTIVPAADEEVPVQSDDTQSSEAGSGEEQGNPAAAVSNSQPGKSSSDKKQKQRDSEGCDVQTKKAVKVAENCIKIKVADKRSSCFNEMPNKLPKGFAEKCQAESESLKSQYAGKEKQLYPNQSSSFGQMGSPDSKAGKDSPVGVQPPAGKNGQPTIPPSSSAKPASPAECSKYESGLKKDADACIKQKNVDKRKACFDKVGEKITKENIADKCSQMVGSLKATYQAQESQTYPKDPPSIQ